MTCKAKKNLTHENKNKGSSTFDSTLQIYTAGNGTHVKNVKVTSICRRYYNVEL